MRRGFTIHHNGPPANCLGQPHSRCVSFWDAVRAFHTNPEPVGKGWSDIAYSFGVCPHGERLVGRGWDRRQWANGTDMVGADDGDDSEWYTVLVFVGGDTSTGDTEAPTPEMIAATAALIAEGRVSGRCGNRVTPHNFWKRKPCPGPHFTPLARAWDNQLITVAPPAPEPPEEPDMYVFDCKGKPALVVGLAGVQRINASQRGALKDVLGVKVVRNDDHARWEALWSLAAKPLDVDEDAVADALFERLAPLPAGQVDATVIRTELRAALADVHRGAAQAAEAG